MVSEGTFCNSPWYEIHIFWDGSLAYCCGQTPNRPYPTNLENQYNIKNMSMADWYNSKPMRMARLAMNSDERMSDCSSCWYQEKFSNSSRRHRSNSKSVIFKNVFNESYIQSPHHDVFEYSFKNDGETKQLPIDLHIDLGNYCDLACKFCSPDASSKVASQYIKWGVLDVDTNISSDWTKDKNVWGRFLNEIGSIENLKNIHFMGGETLITPKFEEMVDALITNKRFDVGFSFVSNGMTFNRPLMDKLSMFSRVGIEVSIETLTKHNEYIRQGTNNNVVLDNLKKYIEYASDSTIDVTIRPAVSLLSIGYYHTLLKHCLDNKLLLKSNNVSRDVGWNSSKCLDVRVLPMLIRKTYLKKYEELLELLQPTPTLDEPNLSDSNNYISVLRIECEKCIALLSEEHEHDLYPDLIALLEKWDKARGFNAIEYYPELEELLIEYNYDVS